MNSSALISKCERYRYNLTRSWGTARWLRIVMLNPSTADANQDDPTIRRVVGFAKANGHGGVMVLNLYALRSKSPRMLNQPDAIGPVNDRVLTDELRRAVDNDFPVLAAWGATRWARQRGPIVHGLVPGVRWVCLGLTKDGQPRHPLYVPASQPFVDYTP